MPPLDEADQAGNAFHKLDPTCQVPTLNRQLSGAESLRSTNDVLQDRPEIEKQTYPRSLCVTTSTINGGARHYHAAKNEQHKNHHCMQRKVLSFLPTSIADPVRDHGNRRYREVVYKKHRPLTVRRSTRLSTMVPCPSNERARFWSLSRRRRWPSAAPDHTSGHYSSIGRTKPL